MDDLGVRLQAFADKANEINARYDNERRVTGDLAMWTPRQKRRICKQKRKWHRRMLGEWSDGNQR